MQIPTRAIYQFQNGVVIQRQVAKWGCLSFLIVKLRALFSETNRGNPLYFDSFSL